MSTYIGINIQVDPDEFQQVREAAKQLADEVKELSVKSIPNANVSVILNTVEAFNDTEAPVA